jgi:hypothetical protein
VIIQRDIKDWLWMEIQNKLIKFYSRMMIFNGKMLKLIILVNINYFFFYSQIRKKLNRKNRKNKIKMKNRKTFWMILK